MTHYEIHAKDTDFVERIKKGQWGQVKNFLSHIASTGETELARYYVKGVEVSFKQMQEEANREELEWKANRKQVTYYTGVCGPKATNGKHITWVRK